MIQPPYLPKGHADRLLSCEEELEPAFLELMEAAIAAGWDSSEAASAVTALADAYVLARNANAATDAAIKEAGQAKH